MDDNKILGRQVRPFLQKNSEFYEWLKNEHAAYSIRNDQAPRTEFLPSSKWPRECLRLRIFRVNLRGS